MSIESRASTADTIPGYQFHPHNLTYTFDYEKTHEHRKMREENILMREEINGLYAYKYTADSIFQINRSIVKSMRYIIDQYKATSKAYNTITIAQELTGDIRKDLLDKSVDIIKDKDKDIQKQKIWKNVYKYSGIGGLVAGLVYILITSL